MTREEMWKEFENQLIRETRTPITMSFDDAEILTKTGIKETVAKWKRRLEQTRWIPVSEKLPEDGTYLVTVERTRGVPRIETKSFAKDLHRVDDYDFPEHKCGWYEYDSEYGYWEDTDVIAWMPLPQPYKGGKWGC